MLEFNEINAISLNSIKPVKGMFALFENSTETRVVVRQGTFMHVLKYNKNNTLWIREWKEEVFDENQEQPWAVTDNLRPNRVIALNHKDGIRYYGFDKNWKIKLLFVDQQYRGKTITQMGMFYPSLHLFGIITLDPSRELRFHGLAQENFKRAMKKPNNQPSFRFSLSGINPQILPEADLTLINWDGTVPSIIVLFDKEGLKLYKVNFNFQLEKVSSSTEIRKIDDSDKIYFGNLTNQGVQDILYINASALQLFQYNPTTTSYELLTQYIDSIEFAEWKYDYAGTIYLFDINSDGIDDLLFTNSDGLQLFTFDVDRKKFIKLKSAVDTLPKQYKFSKVVGAIKPLSESNSNPLVFLQITNGVVWSTEISVSGSSKSEPEINSINDTSSPNEVQRSYTTTLPHLTWIRQFGQEFLKQPVNLETGHVQFTIPLIDISAVTGWGLQWTLTYTSEAIKSNLLGNGWSLMPELSYIAVNHQNSIFQEDFIYHLVTNGNQIQLKYENHTEQSITFKFEEKSAVDEKIVIKYNKIEESWTVDSDAERVVYGKKTNKNALIQSLGWRFWRGTGRGGDDQTTFVVGWYVSERTNKFLDRTIYYEYEQDLQKVEGGHHFTSALRLKTISEEDQLKVSFSYNKKLDDEYDTPVVIDEKGHIVLPVPLVQSHYLSNIVVETNAYKQKFRFHYKDATEKGRLLKYIEQLLPSRHQTILVFDYLDYLGKSVMQTCYIPEQHIHFTFEYDNIRPPKSKLGEENFISHSFESAPVLVYGTNYAVALYQEEGEIKFYIMDQKLLRIEKACGSEHLQCPVVNEDEELKGQKILALKDTFAVLVEATNKNYVLFYGRSKGNWVGPKTYSYAKKFIIQTDSQAKIIVHNPKTADFEMFQPNADASKWKKISISVPITPPVTRFNIENRLLLAYNNSHIGMAYMDFNRKWQPKLLDKELPDLSFTKVLNMFNTTSEAKESYLSQLKYFGLQSFHNLILITGIIPDKGYLASQIQVLPLDENYNVEIPFEKTIRREKITDMKLDVDVRDANIKSIQLNYRRTGHEFYTAKVTDHKLDITNPNSNKNHINDSIAASLAELTRVFENKAREIFLLDMSKYTAYANPSGIYWGSKYFLDSDPTGWRINDMPKGQTISLGKHLTLKTDTNDPLNIDLCNDDTVLHTITLDSHGKLVTVYPAYIAYQSDKGVIVLTFKDEVTLQPIISLVGERLLMESNMHNLITWQPENKRILNRPVSTFKTALLQTYVTKMKVHTEDFLRETGYERRYDVDTQEGIFMQRTVMIPGAEKSRHGWYETTFSYELKTENLEREERWYNSTSSIIRVRKTTNQDGQQPKQDTEDLEMQLYDRMNRWVISDFSPYSMPDEMTGYVGFESYESGQIGGKEDNKIWMVEDGVFVRNQFAFTGNGYLQLNSETSYIEGVFTPIDTKITYLIACWIRSDEIEKNINDSVEYLKAHIYTPQENKVVGLVAKVKNKQGSWIYLELPIDMNQMHKLHTEQTGEDLKGIPFTVKIEVRPIGLESLDIDHIRFHPITHDFQATVFDPYTAQSIATIYNSGLISQSIYSRFNQQIAVIQQKNRLERLTSKGAPTHSVPFENIPPTPCNTLFQPQSGYYETFERHSFLQHWKVEVPAQWDIAPGQLWHRGDKFSTLQAKPEYIDHDSCAIRLYVTLQAADSSLRINHHGIEVLLKRQNRLKYLAVGGTVRKNFYSTSAELILLYEQPSVFVWFNGILMVDEEIPSTSNDLSIEFKNTVVIEDLFIMNKANVTIEYLNDLKETTQTMQLVDSNRAILSEILYDELGRDAISTKQTYVSRIEGGPLLAFRSDFVETRSPQDPDSVFKIGILKGEVNDLNPDDKGYPYSRIVYQPNPLNRPTASGLPGPDFSAEGSHAVLYLEDSGIELLEKLFPKENGFHQKTKKVPSGCMIVEVFDSHNNQVAEYTSVPGNDDTLATYEYDEENHLVKILPPEYHAIIDTVSRLDRYETNYEKLNAREQLFQKECETRHIYDENGKLVLKKTPDTGTQQFLYNGYGKLRFIVQTTSKPEDQEVVYFNHNMEGKIISSGYLTAYVPIDELYKYVDTEIIPLSRVYQSFDDSNDSRNPMKRGMVKHSVTYSKYNRIIEKFTYDEQDQVISKEVVTDLKVDTELTDIKKTYDGNRLQVLSYPSGLQVMHSYNKLGQLIGIGTPENKYLYGKFDYTADGKLLLEQHQHFERNFKYNSPGWLTQIADKFLIETLNYTDDGYGQVGLGDGMIMSATYEPFWNSKVDKNVFRVEETDFQHESASKCIRALINQRYLNKEQQPIRMFVPSVEHRMPLQCGGNFGDALVETLAKKLAPTIYGHKYAYGSHQELIKAKHFSGTFFQPNTPFNENVFTQIEGVTPEYSKEIFWMLEQNGFIFKDDMRFDPQYIQGHPGEPIYKQSELTNVLKSINPEYVMYEKPIAKLFMDKISMQSSLSIKNFISIFKDWEGVTDTDTEKMIEVEKKVEAIVQALVNKNYLPLELRRRNFLSNNFISALEQVGDNFYKVMRIMVNQFNYAIGQSPFDVESYQMDANGNHKLFYAGFKQYDINYKRGTNQIQDVRVGSKHFVKDENGEKEIRKEISYKMNHDIYGNVVKALHKNILRITYHPVSQRTTTITLMDETQIFFYYDAKGERVMKRIFPKGKGLSAQVYYVRDENGRVLTDRLTNYYSDGQKEVITNYIYGPRGLIGFERNQEFYNVFTDHLQSVRLVIKNGQVVGAYDYMPYGGLMRTFDVDSSAYIRYRYAGQEYDEETGLYNFHARLYDPTIGRFYQPDPRGQFFSPYKYAGNSPITYADPNGEFIFLIFIAIGALVGAYLGAAAANNRWNPVDWDWTHYSTWIGIGTGAVTGAMMPGLIAGSIGAVGVAGTLALGAGGAYLSAAASQFSIDPTKWAWDRPTLWNAVFQGISTGVGLAGGLDAVHKLAAQFSTTWKRVFLTISYASAFREAYASAAAVNDGNWAFWEWDYENYETYTALIEGFTSGVSLPSELAENGVLSVLKLAKNPKKTMEMASSKTKKAIKNILKNPRHSFYKLAGSIVMAYFMGAQFTNELDITKWDLTSFATYQAIIDGAMMGPNYGNLLELAHQSRGKLTWKSFTPKKLWRDWREEIIEVISVSMDIVIDHGWDLIVDKIFTKDAELTDQIEQEEINEELNKQVAALLNEGRDKLMGDPDAIPSELKKFLIKQITQTPGYQKLEEWKKNNQEITEERSVLITDEMKTIKTCTNIMRSQSCEKPEDPGYEFEEDPVLFMRKYVVSMKNLSVDKPINSKDRPFVYNFELKDKPYGYALRSAPPTAKGPNIVKGYFLDVSNPGLINQSFIKLTFPIKSDIKFIFTPDTLGSTIGIYKEEDDLHVYRLKREPLEAIYVNERDGVKIYEDKKRYMTKTGTEIQELEDVEGHLYDKSGNMLENNGICIIPFSEIYHTSKLKDNEELDDEIQLLAEVTKIDGESVVELQKNNERILADYNYFNETYITFEDEKSAEYQLEMKKIPGAMYMDYSTVIFQTDNSWNVLYQKHDSYVVKNNNNNKKSVLYEMRPDSLQGRILFNKREAEKEETDDEESIETEESIVAPIHTDSNFKKFIGSKTHQLPPSSDSSMPSISSPEYTSYHLNGTLQLLDLGIKRFMGHKEKSQKVHQMTWQEASILATEVIDDFEINLEEIIDSLQIPKHFVNVDFYELYQKISKKLIANNVNGAITLLEVAARNAAKQLKYNKVKNHQINEFSDELFSVISVLYEQIVKMKRS